jgi:acyl-CoA thioester hydrolase
MARAERDPRRLEPEAYPLRFATRVMFGDVDAYRHGNNVAIARFVEEGRVELMGRAFGARHMLAPPPDRMVLLASLHIDYLAQLSYPGTVMVASAVGRIGTSSYDIVHGLFSGGGCVALADTVMVKTDGRRSAALAPDERAALEALVLG